jgi:hypothetical protein
MTAKVQSVGFIGAGMMASAVMVRLSCKKQLHYLLFV